MCKTHHGEINMFTKFKRTVYLLMAVVLLTTVLPTVIPVQVEAANPTKVVKTAKKGPTIASIANLSSTVDVDAVVSMPESITAVMSDKTKKNVAIKWDTVLNSDMDGIYSANGTVAGYDKKITYTLKVKAPKMGTIDIPKVTDSTLKKPSNIKLGIGKGIIEEDCLGKELDETLLSLFWTLESVEADEYAVVLYDQYKRIVYNGGICLNPEDIAKKQGCNRLQLEKTKNLIISAVTITPIKSTEEGRMTGDRSKNGVGETAVFDCLVRVIVKNAKSIKLNAKPNESNPEAYDFSFSEKVSPYKYFDLRSDYKFKNSDCYGYSERGYFSAKDGSVLINYVDSREYNEIYANLSAKLNLLVYSDAVVESSNKGVFTVTIYPVDYKDNPVAKAAKAFDGVYKNGNQILVVSTKGTDAQYFIGDIHVIQDLGIDIFYLMNTNFDGNKKITNTTVNANGPMVTIELTLDGDTIHYTRTFHQENNTIEKLDFKRTKENALATYEKYYKLIYSK